MRKILSFVIIVFLSSSIFAQRTPSSLRVKTDANGYLLAAGMAQTAPISNPTVFTNARLKTDASGNLLVVITGGTISSSISVNGNIACISAGCTVQVPSGGSLGAGSSFFITSTGVSGRMTLQNDAANSGVGLDLTTDGTLYCRNRAYAADCIVRAGTFSLGSGNAVTVSSTATQIKSADAGAYLIVDNGFVGVNSSILRFLSSGSSNRSIIDGSATDGLISFKTSSNATGLEINLGVPTLGTCTGGTLVSGAHNGAGEITGNTSGSCILNFGTPNFTNAPFCTLNDETSLVAARVSARSASSITITGLTSGDAVQYICLGRIGT